MRCLMDVLLMQLVMNLVWVQQGETSEARHIQTTQGGLCSGALRAFTLRKEGISCGNRGEKRRLHSFTDWQHEGLTHNRESTKGPARSWHAQNHVRGRGSKSTQMHNASSLIGTMALRATGQAVSLQQNMLKHSKTCPWRTSGN